MRYECKRCKYVTDRISNYKSHLKTKIHLRKVKKYNHMVAAIATNKVQREKDLFKTLNKNINEQFDKLNEKMKKNVPKIKKQVKTKKRNQNVVSSDDTDSSDDESPVRTKKRTKNVVSSDDTDSSDDEPPVKSKKYTKNTVSSDDEPPVKSKKYTKNAVSSDDSDSSDDESSARTNKRTKNVVSSDDTDSSDDEIVIKTSIKTTICSKQIPKNIKSMVWNKYIGREKGIGKCYVCKGELDAKHFEAGHIIARANGGENSVENLRPICSLCNKSIGSKNMDKFKKSYLLDD